MKKRYARILAATLSAAMVFTSAPTGFAGLDLGVIEAQAVGVYYVDADAAAQKAEEILNGMDWDVEVKDVTGPDTSATIVNGRLTSQGITTAMGNAGFTLTLTPVTTPAATINDYKYTASVVWTKADGVSEETIQLAERTFKITKNKVNSNFADFTTVKTAKFAIGTNVNDTISETNGIIKAFTEMKDANGETVAQTEVLGAGLNNANINGYVVDADSLTALKNATKTGTKTLKFVNRVTDADEYDYAALDGFISQSGPLGRFEKTIEVTLTGATVPFVAGSIADTQIAYELGADKVTLSGNADTYFKVDGYNSTDLAKVPAGTLNVVLKSKVAYSDEDYDLAASLDALQNAGTEAWRKTWAYDSQGYFTVCMPMPAVTATKNLAISQIKWPTKLKDGTTTIAYNANLSKVELEETETVKAGYGKFVLVHHANACAHDATLDAAAQTTYDKYCIRFVPAKNGVGGSTVDVKLYNPAAGDLAYGGTDIAEVTDGATGIGTSTADATAVTVEKKDCITLSCAKKEVAKKDISVTYNPNKEDVKYGTKISDLSVTFPAASQAVGTYTLKDAKADDVLKVGKNTITYVYKVKDSAKYQIEGGVESVEVSFDVNIDAPSLKAEVTGQSYATVGKASPTLIAGLVFDNVRNGVLATTDLKVKSYQWYSASAGKIYNADKMTYSPSTAKAMEDTLSCEIVAEVKAGVAADKKAMYEGLLGSGVLKSDDFKVTITSMTVTLYTALDLNLAGLNAVAYDSINKILSAKVDPADGYTFDSATWTVKNTATKETVTIEGTAANNVIKATVPKDLEVGKYTISAEVTAKSSTATDSVTITWYNLEIKKAAALPTSVKLEKVDVAKEDKEVAYGTKLKDIKIVAPEGTEKYGKYEWLDGETVVSSEAKVYPVRFIANKFARANYNIWDTVNVGLKINVIGTQDFEIAGIKATKKAELTLTADDITVSVGDKLPEATYSVKGLVGSDTIENIGLDVVVKVDTTKVDTTKANTYADVITVTATYNDLTNEKINALANYTVKVVPGSVIVKAKEDVAPSVKPTPAPVKQATAAAPKAAKAKATVKVGKKYTLKLKYAAGKKATVKKVTWKSSKKSVATVSSKGKVTAVKAGKATIAATITFKDGSKKKVKFTVTVK